MHGQSVNIIDRGMWVMMVMALSSEACSAHAVVTVTLLRLGGAITVIFAFIQNKKIKIDPSFTSEYLYFSL